MTQFPPSLIEIENGFVTNEEIIQNTKETHPSNQNED